MRAETLGAVARTVSLGPPTAASAHGAGKT